MTAEDGAILVPTYQIDLMWHTHILTSLTNYNADCMRLCGSLLNHDDSINDRSEGSTLNVAFERTCALWKRTYGVAYQVHGGMYRGDPPQLFFTPEWTWAPAMLPSKNAHLAGIMGASSTFQMTQQPSPVMSDPPPVYSFLPSNTPGAFIAQKPKSTTKGINANPPIKGYVFGKGQHGWGYYKIGTEEAYNVLQNRLGKQIETLQANICPSCFCCGILCCEDSNTKKIA